MLFWQRKNIHNSASFVFMLFCASAVIHIAGLGSYFFIFKDRTSRLSLNINPDLFNQEIQFTVAPLPKKEQPKPLPVPSKATATAAAREKVEPEKQDFSKKEVEKIRTTIAKKPAPKKVSKKTAPKKKAPDKKLLADKKKVPDKKAEPAKKDDPAPAEKKVPEPEKKAEPTDPLAAVDHHELNITQMGMHEKGLLEEFKLLHEDIVAQWAPPPGIAPTCACKVTMLIDWTGAIKEFTVNESSGVLMYDMAAQRALTQVKMPKWSWGKEITITFNQ